MRAILIVTCIGLAIVGMLTLGPLGFIIMALCGAALCFEARPETPLKRDYDNRVRR
jgi:hypothetical protein